MWPFKEPKKTPGAIAPKAPTATQRLDSLEARVAGLEAAIIQLCGSIQANNQLTDFNFRNMEQSFLHLVKYVMTPRTSIMGDQREKN